MSELLSWIGLIIGFAAIITVIAVAILWLIEKLQWLTEKLERRTSARDPQTATNKKSNYEYKTRLERYEELLRRIANDLVTSGATAGSTQLTQAVDDYSKAAKKVINRSIFWTMIATALMWQGFMAARQRGWLPAFLKPDSPAVSQPVQPNATPVQPQAKDASHLFAKDLATLRGLKSWTEMPKEASEKKAENDAAFTMARSDSPEQYYPAFAADVERDWAETHNGQPFNEAQRRYALSSIAPDIVKHIQDAYKRLDGNSERMSVELQAYGQQVRPIWQQTLNVLGKTEATAPTSVK